jgi:hypothetical protein
MSHVPFTVSAVNRRTREENKHSRCEILIRLTRTEQGIYFGATVRGRGSTGGGGGGGGGLTSALAAQLGGLHL